MLGPTPVGMSILGVVAGVLALATYQVAGRLEARDARSAPPRGVPVQTHSGKARSASDAPPSAPQFAVLLVTLGNLYGAEHGKSARFAGADCVQGSPGHYLCSYAVVRTGRPNECHLVQAEWTPRAASTYRIAVGGRVARCHTLREAIASLK